MTIKQKLLELKKGKEKEYMDSRKIRYSIYKNKVWVELLYKKDKKEVIMNQQCVYDGRNKKDCEKWLEEREKKNVKKNR